MDNEAEKLNVVGRTELPVSMTREERLELIRKPFPMVRVIQPTIRVGSKGTAIRKHPDA